ncbi:hypothetical protein [Legionella geestiana]|uniref:hypothetical protein n=1 Tax=Legionella geestiana TaxID=45065 RepID=UPI00048DF8AE|nr:hypothetical protein [Legionella geestiana]QBS13519.1 hypothetical protein E4T54_11830 [Legionella geestiana]STX59201.1 Uncharacterised protein [Legionella geestiana]
MLILKKILEIIKRKNDFAFSIVDEVLDEESRHVSFNVRLEGKCLSPVQKNAIDLLKIARDKTIFSDDDYDKILMAVIDNQRKITEKKYQSQYSLINHRFSEQLEAPLVVYMDDKNKLHIKLAKEVYSNIEILRKFKAEDSACIGSIVGYHDAEQEFKMRNSVKRNNVITLDRRVRSI